MIVVTIVVRDGINARAVSGYFAISKPCNCKAFKVICVLDHVVLFLTAFCDPDHTIPLGSRSIIASCAERQE